MTIYLDHASTTPTDPEILKEMLPYFKPEYSNPSSMHTSGRSAKAVIDKARWRISECINCSPDEIIFTGSGTEADNLAIVGIARAHREHGNHIIISAIEHKAVLEPAKLLKNEGFEVSILPVDRDGLINITECLKLIKKETILVSVMCANNEIGTIEPIQHLARAIHACRGSRIYPLLHTDACQASGYLSLDVVELGIDLMTLNSSKNYGPKGVGMLYKRRGIKIAPLITGGDQEKGLRAGTENIALIYGFALALEKVQRNRIKEGARIQKLRDYFYQELKKRLPQIELNGHPILRLPNNLHISIPAVEGESMLLMLDQKGIEASTGSACSALDLKPSHVLLAINQNEEIIHGSIRFTLGRHTTKKDIDYVLKVFPPIVEHLTLLSAVTKYHEKEKVS
jgi:cysteine desulfurase